MPDESAVGVYFSANDVVYDWAIAFLNSFRTFNPDLRLLLIPFNEQCDRLLQLRERYGFELYVDDTFDRLEAIGQAFELGHTLTGPHWFRRYTAFWGPLERFMYLDARQLVLADLQPLIKALDEYQFDFLHYDCAINQVYEPGPFRRTLLQQGRSHGFNSGRWISRKDLFWIEEFEQFANEALSIREQLNPRNTDQAFINYCCDMKPVRCGHISEVMGGICQNAWARQPGQIYKEKGKYYLWDHGGQDHKKQIVLLHWAGQEMNSVMPHRGLFNRFYLLHQSVRNSLLFHLKCGIDALWRHPFMLVRRNRVVNKLYHATTSRIRSLLTEGT